MRKGFALFLLLCLLGAAGLCEEAQDAFRAAHPGYAIAAQDVWGDTAAAVMEGDGQRVLLVAERQDGVWRIAIDNPNALDPSSPCPSLFLDTDTALYWTYADADGSQRTFSCFREGGVWGDVGLIIRTGLQETLYDYDGGSLRVQHITCDENDNVIARREGMAFPGRWMQDMMPLDRFDMTRLPHGYAGAWNWPGEYALSRTAEELFAGYAYLDGDAESDGLRFLLRRPDGETVFAGVTPDDTGLPRRAESTPLPENARTYLGDENFTSALVIEWGERRASLVIAPYADGTWGLRQCPHFVHAQLGKNWMMEEFGHRVFGEHPWSDITTIDWNGVPTSEAELRAAFDPDGWATPNNPNPEDRLHLRAEPDRSAASLGKYYNGTPVRVLARGETWTQVDICGVTGYMMTRYLAFGEAARAVAQAPASALFLRADEAALYAAPREDASQQTVSADPMVIGVLGETWFHVWYPDTDLSGYMKQDALWPGNG